MRFSFLAGANNAILQDIDDNTVGLGAQLATLLAQTDELESRLQTLITQTDGVESSLTSLVNQTDTVESLLSAIDTQTDNLDALLENPIAGRNPDVPSGSAVVTSAPHVLTSRISYVVPTNRVARITGLFFFIRRVTAATAPSGPAILLEHRLGAGAFSNLMHYFLSSNGVGDILQIAVPCDLYLEEGNEIRMSTQDSSTGGTVSYSMAMMINEVDES